MLLFQFHSGSIKRLMDTSNEDKQPEFQFHSGSIKSSDEAHPSRHRERFQFHSGSIKRTMKNDVWGSVKQSFNSIVVRLKDAAIAFRSHPRWSFNSIVVRLKADRAIPVDAKFRGFNSIVVRLKGRMGKILHRIIDSFNSIVVRLKAQSHSVFVPKKYLFQFHSGSIKRRKRRECSNAESAVSIP